MGRTEPTEADEKAARQRLKLAVAELGNDIAMFREHLDATPGEIAAARLCEIDAKRVVGIPTPPMVRFQSIRRLEEAASIHANLTKSLAKGRLLTNAFATIAGMIRVIRAAAGCLGIERVSSVDAKAKGSTRGRKAADAKHDKPGASRDKQARIKAIWASGKYSSRDTCADQESAALNMSPSAARKALRNTPKPVKPT